jgi:hypothetical protein
MWFHCRTRYFLISNFRRVLNVVCFLLGNSPAYEFHMPTFRNTLSVPSSYDMRYEEILHTYPPMKMEQTVFRTLAYEHNIQTPGNYPEESIKQDIFCPHRQWRLCDPPPRDTCTINIGAIVPGDVSSKDYNA